MNQWDVTLCITAWVHVWPIATDVAWCVCVCLVTTMNCAKTTEPIQIPVGIWTHGAQVTMYWGRDPQGTGQFGGDFLGNIRRAEDIFNFIE